MKDKGTVFVGIIAAALIALYFFREKLFEVVTVKVGGQPQGTGSFCAPGYLPVSLGVAPSWNHLPITKIRFFVDPATGCLYEGGTARTYGFIRYVTLSKPEQIAAFLQMNGDPPYGGGQLTVGGIRQVLGPALCAPAGIPSVSGATCPTTVNPCPDGSVLESGPDGNPVCVQYLKAL